MVKWVRRICDFAYYEVRKVPKREGGYYKDFFGPDGTWYRTQGEAKKAGWKEP